MNGFLHRAHRQIFALGLALLCAGGALAAPARDAEVTEVRTDAFSVRDLATDARRVPMGGALTLSGLEIAPGAGLEILDLARFQVFADGARVVVHGEDGDETLPAPDNAYFRGRVAGDPASRALLSVSRSGRVRGVVERKGRVYLLREGGRAGGTAAPPRQTGGLAPDPAGGPAAGTDASGDDTSASTEPVPLEAVGADTLEAAPPFTCGNDDLGVAAEGPLTAADFATAVPESLTTTPYTAKVAIETDWELYQRFGNAQDATDYIGDLIAYASSIYDDEIDTDLQISHLSLWASSSDPWAQTSSSCGLYDFGRWWNDNRDGVDRTIAHFISGKSSNSGIAWVGVLCTGEFIVNLGTACPGLSPSIDNYGGAYGYTSGIDGNFDPDSPSPVWDMVGVSHEIGHNFNSPHTHCYNGLGGSSQPVDECYNGQAGQGCYAGTASLPFGCPGAGLGCGTLMSYCHLRSGGLANMALTFGEGHPYGTLPQRVPDHMRAHVESRAACMPRVGGCTEHLSLTSGIDTGPETYQVCGTITAGSGYGIGPNGDVTFSAGRVVLTDGFFVASGASLRVDV